MDKGLLSNADAVTSLSPNAQWTMIDDDYQSINWISKDIDQPSEEAVSAERKRLQDEYDSLEYQRLRAAEYPDFREYLDGLVKGDLDQMQAYIDACQAVKEKYPKPNPES